MQATTADTLRVPGASLYYEVRGTGPVLLLICGGVYDAAGYAGLAHQLQDRYTVVTYDRRGNSRSPLDGPDEPQRIDVHGDDAHRLLSEVGVTAGRPAYVFGNSSGAMIGLELAARHPEQLRALVAHEPPIFELLPDRERWRLAIRDFEAAYRASGPGAAMQVLGAALAMDSGQEERVPGGADAPQGQPDPETMAMLARFEKNMAFFIGCEVPPFSHFVPDADALRASNTRVVAAVGAASEGQPPYRAGVALAERLGSQLAIFPGDHGGFGAAAGPFAIELDEVLAR